MFSIFSQISIIIKAFKIINQLILQSFYFCFGMKLFLMQILFEHFTYFTYIIHIDAYVQHVQVMQRAAQRLNVFWFSQKFRYFFNIVWLILFHLTLISTKKKGNKNVKHAKVSKQTLSFEWQTQIIHNFLSSAVTRREVI